MEHFEREDRGATAVAAVERQRVDPAEGTGWAKVLLVEDDPLAARALARRLRAEGLTVVMAPDGILGLEAARSEDPDLILLDIHLPRLDGFKFLHWLRRRPEGRGQPVLAITGDPDPRIGPRARGHGVLRVLHKPIGDRALIDAIRAALLGYYDA